MQQLESWLDQLGPFTPYVIIGGIAVVVGTIVYVFRSQIRWLIHTGMKAFDLFWSVQLWAYPAILLIVGYLLPGLRTPASIFIPLEARGDALILVGVGIVLFVVQLITANSPITSLGALVADFLFAGIWAVVLIAVCGFFAGRGGFGLWLAIPAVFVLLDLFVNTVVTIRNAYQRTEVSPGPTAR